MLARLGEEEVGPDELRVGCELDPLERRVGGDLCAVRGGR